MICEKASFIFYTESCIPEGQIYNFLIKKAVLKRQLAFTIQST